MPEKRRTMTPVEEAAWAHSISQGLNPQVTQPKRTRRSWDIEELWELVAIFNSKGLRDSSEFVLWLEKQ